MIKPNKHKKYQSLGELIDSFIKDHHRQLNGKTKEEWAEIWYPDNEDDVSRETKEEMNE